MFSVFGQKGPYCDYNDRDLAVLALSGYIYITAELHRPVFLGEHTEYICKDILGISDDDFVRMQNNGVFD
jgi:crotonobetainyl-CoA:carnitine CoA-transferase CaiB-like acyl-CoA transferase